MQKPQNDSASKQMKILPSQIESLEASVLTLILNNPSIVDKYGLTPEHFTTPTIRLILETAFEVMNEHDRISLPLLHQAIPNKEVHNEVAKYWRDAKDPENIDVKSQDFYVRQISQAMRQRKIDSVLQDYDNGLISPNALAGKIEEASRQESKLERVRSITMADGVRMMFNYIQNPDTESRISTGFSELDRMLVGGLAKQELTVLAARPSVGKTAFTLNMSTNMGKENPKTGKTSVGYFSGETGFMPLLFRVVAAECNIDMTRLQTSDVVKVDMDLINRFVNRAQDMSELPMSIHDSGGWDVYEIRRQIIRDMELHGNENYVAFIDHLGKIKKHTNHTRDDLNVGAITFELKQIAIELNIHIVLLSQLNRNTESRQDKRPTLGDLRNSGDIEQDADVVIFLYRDDYYNKETEDANTIEVIVAKSRNTGQGQIKLAFKKEYQKMVQLHFDSVGYAPPA